MLDIGVGDTANPFQPPDPAEPSLGLEDDGYYWFLHPLFEQLLVETGQYIDLYGYAVFAGANLVALNTMLTEARRRVEAQPEIWDVHTGMQLRPVHQEIFEQVVRVKFLRLLTVWERVAARAQESGRAVVCFGD